jgi:integrase
MAAKVRNLLDRDGRYFARVVVPTELREFVGKRELLTPLGPDRRNALKRLPSAVAAHLDTLATARRIADAGKAPPSRPVSNIEIARLHYEALLREDEQLRNILPLSGDADLARSGSVASLNAAFGPGRERVLRRIAAGTCEPDEMAAVMGASVDIFRDRGMTNADEGSPEWRALARMLAGVELDALLRSFERDRGDFAGRPALPILNEPAPTDLAAEAVPLTDLLKGYAAELGRSGRGVAAEQRWRPCFAALKAFLKHDDARRLTRPDVVRWKEHLLTTLAAKTVRDVYLGGLKAVLAWAVDDGKLETNVAAGVKVRVPKKTRNREAGFTDAEAVAILKTVSAYMPKPSANPRTRESAQITAAKRWVPWLCALTGARVAELCQLRKDDIRLDDATPHIRITPEAGSVKTAEYRDVPIHAQLVAIGFPDFVRAHNAGPLFYDATSKRKSPQHPAKQTAKRLATWMRSLATVPADVNPNHGWRHRLKTVGRDHGIDARVMDAIQGHAPRTAGEGYGDVSLVAKARAIEKIPPIPVD